MNSKASTDTKLCDRSFFLSDFHFQHFNVTGVYNAAFTFRGGEKGHLRQFFNLNKYRFDALTTIK